MGIENYKHFSSAGNILTLDIIPRFFFLNMVMHEERLKDLILLQYYQSVLLFFISYHDKSIGISVLELKYRVIEDKITET